MLTHNYKKDLKNILGEDLVTDDFVDEFFKSLNNQLQEFFKNMGEEDQWPTQDLKDYIQKLVRAHTFLAHYEYLIKRANTVLIAHFYYYIDTHVKEETVTPKSMWNLLRTFKKEGK